MEGILFLPVVILLSWCSEMILIHGKCTWILKNVVININGVSCSQEGKTCNTTYRFILELTHGPRGYCIKSVDPLNIFCNV